ncbi:MAG: hypothetical protein HY422_02570 [Candidatus Komeilibacteria bacterium]|nr:hypothetical protein [Candidatus Komeilibacteria bacterium]
MLRSKGFVFGLCLSVLFCGACAKRPLLRTHTATPPQTIAMVTPPDGSPYNPSTQIPPVSPTPNVTPQQADPRRQAPYTGYKVVDPDVRTVGRSLNNEPGPVTVHVPPDWLVLPYSGEGMTYEQVWALPDDVWVKWNFLPIPPGVAWWVKAPANYVYRVYYDVTINGYRYSRYADVTNDTIVGEHRCPAVTVDFFMEFGTRICR